MKTIMKITALSAFLLMLLAGLASCEREPEHETPKPEFYFEGYLNGERFANRMITSDGETRPAVWASFNPDGLHEEIKNGLHIRGETTPVRIYPYPPMQLPSSISLFFEYLGKGKHDSVQVYINDGFDDILNHEESWVIITKFDTINWIVAGTFQIIGQYHISIPSSGGQHFAPLDIRITEGRFRSRFFRIRSPYPGLLYDTKLQMSEIFTFFSKK